jgi:uncharacterized membrane protein
MTTVLALKLYGIALVAFVVLDMLWLGLVANGLYKRLLGPLLRESPNIGAAVAFYALFLVGLVYFAIAPAVDGGTLGDAALKGALFGLFTYATWDLTNLAVLKGFPAAVVPIDMAWGTALGAGVSTATWLTWDRFL